jgi:hypothetical protein
MIFQLKTRIALAGLSALAMLSACGGSNTPSGERPAAGFVLASGNVASAEPNVARPAAPACVVPLFEEQTFNNFASHPFNYNATCSGPWEKVVLEADFSVTAGRQFDRTGHISIGGINLYTGTTQEPSATVGPNWHIERDVTDYAPLFVRPELGSVDLDNLVNDTFTGVLKGSARLVFYPLINPNFKPRAADWVLSLSSRTDGRPDVITAEQTSLSKTLRLPRNVLRAYLDVVAQGQADDEFWWSCAPDSLTDPLQTCGGTALREVQVMIDNQMAGVAPAYPWVFTGGVNPRLWRPLPAVQTLNFRPYRVDLSPFAGVLSDGATHSVSLSVFNARNSFNITGNLLLFLDPQAVNVKGGLISNNLSAPAAPQIDNKIVTSASGDVKGQLGVASSKSFRIVGYVEGSQGREELSVTQTMSFTNSQLYTAVDNNFVQMTRVETTSSVSSPAGSTSLTRQFSFPFSFLINSSNGTRFDTDLGYREAQSYQHLGVNVYRSLIDDNVKSVTSSSGSPAVTTNNSSHHYLQQDENGGCFERNLTSSAALLTAATDNIRCDSAPLGSKPWGKLPSAALDLWLTLGH